MRGQTPAESTRDPRPASGFAGVPWGRSGRWARQGRAWSLKAMTAPAPFSIVHSPDGIVLRLEGAVDIRSARDLAASLNECREACARVVVDTASLTEVDTPILQLLCSLRKSVRELTFSDPSDAFLGMLDRRGMRRALFAPWGAP